MPSADSSRVQSAIAGRVAVFDGIPVRPPQVRVRILHPMQPPHIRYSVRIAIGLRHSTQSCPACAPTLRFLLVGSGFCLLLPSDSVSRRTPLNLANGSRYRARRGLSPPRFAPCWAHVVPPALRAGGRCGSPEIGSRLRLGRLRCSDLQKWGKAPSEEEIGRSVV